MRKFKFRHIEAFCLMIYKCESCNTIEILWNSRDGVTPFTINCRQCNGMASHNYWAMDVRIPEYKPFEGQRIFVDSQYEIPTMFDSVMPVIDDRIIEYEPKTIIFKEEIKKE